MTDAAPIEPETHERAELEKLVTKRNGFLERVDGVRCLAVGSSHGAYAFDSTRLEGAYNLCTISQDLRHSEFLYDFAIRSGAPLTDVILFYSAFSRGLELAKTDERWRCAVLQEVFEFDHDYGDPAIAEVRSRVAGLSRDLLLTNDTAGFVHDADPWFYSDDDSEAAAAVRARGHLKNFARGGQNAHLAAIAERAARERHRLLVVLSPGREDYRAQLSPSDSMFADVYDLQRELADSEPFQILDLFDGDVFEPEEFGDCDHLHPHRPGPAKVARMVAEHLAANSR